MFIGAYDELVSLLLGVGVGVIAVSLHRPSK
jgi:hypothetical protein